MNRVTRGSVMLAAALSALSCSGDPTSGLRNGVDHLIASPSALFIKPDSTKSVVVHAVDAQGNTLGMNLTLDNAATTAAGIQVARDDSFELVYNNSGQLVLPANPTAVRYIVTTAANSDTASFTVSGGGKSLKIPVRIIPATAPLTLSTTSPALGDTVTVTAGTNFKFTPASVLTIPGAGVAQLSMSADSTQIRFLPGPGANSAVLVSNVITTYLPSASYTGTTGASVLTTPTAPAVAATYSTATPNTNDTVHVALPAGFKALPGAYALIGEQAQSIVSVDADSNGFTFRATPPGTGRMTFGNIALSFLTSVPIVDTATSSVTVGAGITTFTGTSALATAPEITWPVISQDTFTLIDNSTFTASADCTGGPGGGYCVIYKFVLSGDATIDVNANWVPNTTDVGVYFADATNSDAGPGTACDQNGRGATASPEHCTISLGAGTYYVEVNSYGPLYPQNDPNPTSIHVTFAAH